MVVFVRSQEQLCGGLTGGKDGGESSSRDMLFTAALFPSASASGGGGGGHLTWRLPVVPTVDGLFTHFIWQTLFQSVRHSRCCCHRCHRYPPPPIRRVSISPDTKWDWKENKRTRDGRRWRRRSKGARLRRGMGNSGMGQSFLINFDPTEGDTHSLTD